MAPTTTETTPLVATNPSNASGNEATGSSSSNSKYYFLGKEQENYHGVGTTPAVRDSDGDAVFEGIPEGTTSDEFAPRQLGPKRYSITAREKSSQRNVGNGGAGGGGGGAGGIGGKVFGFLFGKKKERAYGEVGTLQKLRKAPVKIEPKVFFANERTFLAWMHLSVILAGASIAILAFAEEQNPFSQLYGVVLLPVAIAFIIYSMYQYARRANMIRHRHPGPYEDTTGPTVLGIMLMISILVQFALKLYDMST